MTPFDYPNSDTVRIGWLWIIALLLLALLLGACDPGPQYYRKTEMRSQHYTRMPDAQWCAKANAAGWQPPECPR